MPDSAKAEIYNRIFFHYIFFNIDSAYHYASLSLEMSKKANYPRGIGKYYNNIGILSRVQGDYPEAIKNILQALKINEANKDELGIGNNCVNIGLVYAAERKYEQALNYYRRGLALKKKYKDTTGIAYVYRDMGDTYAELKNYDKAIECYQKCIDLQARWGITYRAMMSIGIIHYKKGEIDSAFTKLTNSLQGLEKHEIFEVATACNALGCIAKDKKEYQKAQAWFFKAIQNAKKYQNKVQLKEAYKNLSECYSLMQQSDNALAYLKNYIALQDSLFNVESTEKIMRMQNTFALRKKEAEIDLMNKEQALKNEKQRAFTNGVLVFAGVALLFLFIFYSSDRRTRKNNKILKIQKNELKEKNEEISQQKEEIQAFSETLENKIAERTQELNSLVNELHQKNKDLADFSYIVAHNIRAPVASVKGLLSLVDYAKIKDAEHTEILIYIQKTIENFETVVDDLDEILEIRNTQKITLEEVQLSQVMQDLQTKLKNEIRRNKVKISTNFQITTLHTNKAYITEIIFQLLSNAIKYQSNQRTLEINIFTKVENDQLLIEVQDNGIGIDLTKVEASKIFGMHQRMHTHVEGKGFGLYLVKNLVEVLHGEIKVTSKLNFGTTFSVYFPYHSTKN